MSIRVRKHPYQSGRIHTDDCGCQHWEHMMYRMCPVHLAEHEARHKKAMEDYRESEKRRLDETD